MRFVLWDPASYPQPTADQQGSKTLGSRHGLSMGFSTEPTDIMPKHKAFHGNKSIRVYWELTEASRKASFLLAKSKMMEDGCKGAPTVVGWRKQGSRSVREPMQGAAASSQPQFATPAFSCPLDISYLMPAATSSVMSTTSTIHKHRSRWKLSATFIFDLSLIPKDPCVRC